MSLKEKHTVFTKKLAVESGFSFCGISKSEFLEEEAARLESWLKMGLHGKMAYMGNHFDKRLDPSKLVPGAKSVISLMFNYYTPLKPEGSEAFRISRYAYGTDYHKILKKKLKQFLGKLKEEVGEINGRIFVDSAPVLEKAWAKRSGIGWMGKNTNIINPQAGSYFFLAELICDLELIHDNPMADYCGSCTACIDACPTEALSTYEIDATKCISYLTIELKDEVLPSDMKGSYTNWIFGCDICQEVCPWNRFSSRHKEPAFEPQPELMDMNRRDWIELTEVVFEKLFEGSPVKRTKFKGLKRNINFLDEY